MKTLSILFLLATFCSASAPALGADAKKTLTSLVNEFNKDHPKELKLIREAISSGKSLDAPQFSESYKKLLLEIYLGYSEKIKRTPKLKSLNPKDQEVANFFKSALEKLEYEEKKVDQTSDELRAHYADLEARQYIFKFRAFLDYMSWQTQASLIGPYETTRLLSTNLGVCPGIGVSYQNHFWAFSSELSGIYGSGGVSAVQGLVSYQQSSVPAYGGKLTLGAARVVAGNGSVLGIHLSTLYVKQNLETPASAGYSVEQKTPLSETVSIFSRWQFNRFYFETDFGRYIGRPATIWALGVGASL